MEQKELERDETSQTKADERKGIEDKGQGVGEARTGPIDSELERDQREASTGVAAGHDSWRPSDDPAAGDLGDTSDQVN